MKLLLFTTLLLASQAHAGVVALTILAESANQGENGMGAVSAVIAQRALNRNITPEQVCLQKWQFSCWNGKSKADLAHLYNTPQAAFALYLEKNIANIDRSKVGFADHYYADYIAAPYWAKGEKPCQVIGSHRFYRLKNDFRVEKQEQQ